MRTADLFKETGIGSFPRRTVVALTSAGIVAAFGIALFAAGPQSFRFGVQSGFTQELFGVTPNDGPDFGILGGVAFAPDGDVWSAECLFDNTVLHRFDLQTTATVNGTSIHPESTPVPTQGGCGLVNHPDGFMYSNSEHGGIWKLDVNSGQPVGAPHGPGGNALGIAVDPKPGAGNHLVYAGTGCHPDAASRHGDTDCTFWDLDPATNEVKVFARVSFSRITFSDGVYFDPTGNFLFVAVRDPQHSLTVIERPAALKDVTAAVDDSQIVQENLMDSEPDGVAFHATDKFVVTLNESDDGAGLEGTMTRFDFPGANYAQAATRGVFAKGGFRGDLLQVGGDGCIYATQGRLFESGGVNAARYDDGTVTPEDSIVRICGGFVPPPGVNPPQPPTPTGRIGDFVWNDLNGNGLQDLGEPGIDGVSLKLLDSSSALVAMTTTAGGGAYLFDALPAGTYTVEVVTPPAGLLATTSGAGGLDSNGSPATVVLATDASEDLSIDFGYVAPPPPAVCNGTIGDFVWTDLNHNGLQDAGEPGISNVKVVLATGGGPVAATTDASGHYLFGGLCAGDYQVSVDPTTVGGLTPTSSGVGSDRNADSNASPTNVTLLTGTSSDLSIDFGFTFAGKVFTIGPSSMEGNLSNIKAGDWVSGGYSFKFIANTHAATTFVVTAKVDIAVKCPGGGTGGTITVPLGTKAFAVPANNTAWLPTGDQNSVLSWQGSVKAPDLCGGKAMDDVNGAVLTATVSQNPPSGTLANFRFKYRDPAAKGKPNTNCLDTSDPNRAKADVCGASWSETVLDP